MTPRTFADLERAGLDLKVTCQRCGHEAIVDDTAPRSAIDESPAGASGTRSAARLACHRLERGAWGSASASGWQSSTGRQSCPAVRSTLAVDHAHAATLHEVDQRRVHR